MSSVVALEGGDEVLPLVDLLELAVREARNGWLQVEQLAGRIGDEELDRRVEMGRLMILDTRDRVEQLIGGQA